MPSVFRPRTVFRSHLKGERNSEPKTVREQKPQPQRGLKTGFFGVLIASSLLTACSSSPKKTERSPDEIKQVIATNMRAIRTCYETAIDTYPGAEGKATTQLEIQADGSVSKVSFSEFDKTLEGGRACWIETLGKMKFSPMPNPETVTDVSYPFFFTERHQR